MALVCSRLSDVILRGNQSKRGEMTAIFLGSRKYNSLNALYIFGITSSFIDVLLL